MTRPESYAGTRTHALSRCVEKLLASVVALSLFDDDDGNELLIADPNTDSVSQSAEPDKAAVLAPFTTEALLPMSESQSLELIVIVGVGVDSSLPEQQATVD